MTNIGGLGAYPTIVIDQAPLEWILSTVAHEWVHNYLSFFPLGFNYGTSGENTILNETVADIVGEEIGAAVLRERYPDVAAQVQAEQEDTRRGREYRRGRPAHRRTPVRLSQGDAPYPPGRRPVPGSRPRARMQKNIWKFAVSFSTKMATTSAS